MPHDPPRSLTQRLLAAAQRPSHQFAGLDPSGPPPRAESHEAQQHSKRPASMSGKGGARALRIKIFRNGDAYFSGRTIVVKHPHKVNWDVFLDAVTEGIQPKFGVVRRMWEAKSGVQIKDMKELKDGQSYVASGRGKGAG